MASNAMDYRKGVQRNAGRGGRGQGAINGISGDGTIVEPVMDRMHGGNGRDERSAKRIAARGNEFIKSPGAHKRTGYE